MTKKELQKKKSELDFVVVVGFLFSFLIVGILILQIAATLMPQMSADATFTLYDVKTIQTSTGNGGYKTTFYYEAEFIDQNGYTRAGLVEEVEHWNIYLFDDYSEKLQEIVNHPPYQNGEVVSVRYSDSFQDGDKVSINANPAKGIILLGILAVVCCLGEAAAIKESSKLNKLISEGEENV